MELREGEEKGRNGYIWNRMENKIKKERWKEERKKDKKKGKIEKYIYF